MPRRAISLTAAVLAVALSSHAGAAAPRGFSGSFGATSVPDGAGGTYVVWTSDRDGPSDVYLLRVTASGDPAPGWPATGLAVCNAPGVQIESGLLPDGSGGVLVGWADFRDEPFLTFGGTADFYAQRVNAAGVPQWTANGVLGLDDFNVAADLNAAGDGAGGMFLTWSLLDFPDAGNIYALRITNTGAIAAGWDPAGELVCADPEYQYEPRVAPDGSGGCYVLWEDQRNSFSEIFGQHLDATGNPLWTADGALLTGGNEAFWPGVCPDGSGGLLAFWASLSGIIGQNFNSAGAEQWTPGGVTIGNGGFSSDEVQCWAAPGGGAYVTWSDQGHSTLVAQRVNGAGAVQWPGPGVTVCVTTGSRFIEDAVIEADGSLSLLWEDERSGVTDLYVQRVNSIGIPAWTANGVPLALLPEEELPIALAPDGSGGLVATWLSNRDFEPEPVAQRVNAAGVKQLGTNGKVVVPDPGRQRLATVVSDGGTGSWIVWHEKVGGDYEIRARRVDANGAPLTGTAVVCDASGIQFIGGAVADGAGGVVIAWEDERGPDNDVYAQRLNGAGVPQWTANGVAVCDAVGDQGNLRMAASGGGAVVIAWRDDRFGPGDIYAQRLDAAGAAQWTAGGVIVCNATGSQSGPVVVPSGASDVIIAWTDNRTIFAPMIAAQRLNGAGAAQWTANGEQISTLNGLIAYCNGAVSDGAGGAIVLYEQQVVDIFGDQSFTTTDVTLQRVDGAGAEQWGAGGTELTTSDAFRERSMLVPDGAGGVIVAWCDARSPHDIYAQRVNAAGAAQWTAGGAVVCNAASWQWLSSIAPDGSGGAVVAWSDERNGLSDVYAQRVNAAGAAQWTANGVAVADVARGQYEAAMHVTGGTPVLVWTDFRDGAERLLYADKLSAGGASQWAADGVTSAQFSMVAAEAAPARVRVTWAVSGDAFEVAAYRRGETGAWQPLGTLPVDGTGRVVLVDESVEPGARYAYRIGMYVDGAERFSGEVWIDVPNDLALAIDGVRPQPARGDVWLTFSLGDDSPARVEVLDVSGRRVGARELRGLAAGRHVVRMPEVPDAAGVYFVVLTQGGESVRGRVVRVR